MMKKNYFDLMQFFEGYVRNYRRFNLTSTHNRSMFTQREINHFAQLGEMLGFEVYIEDSKFDRVRGFSRPMDLSFWKWDQRINDENYIYLALHLERENQRNKDEVTIEKLFSITEEGYVPHNVIGIQVVESRERIELLNDLVMKKNETQQSNVLMIYRYYDANLEVDRVHAFCINSKGISEERTAICKTDEFHYYFMCFDEEYPPFQKEEAVEDKVLERIGK